MTLLICPVRPGEYNEQLRHAVRSWEKNLLLPDGLELMIVGHQPEWIEADYHVSGNYYDTSTANVWDNIWRGAHAAHIRGYEEVIVMNDDFFCVKPVNSVPVWRRNKTLQEHIDMFPAWKSMWFPRSLDLTASCLSEAGFPHPASYDLHRPLFCAPSDLIRAMSKWSGGLDGDIPQWRTLYGVINEVEAEPVDDVKLGVSTSVTEGSDWVSTSPSSWMRDGRRIAGMFPEPSRWEARALYRDLF